MWLDKAYPRFCCRLSICCAVGSEGFLVSTLNVEASYRATSRCANCLW